MPRRLFCLLLFVFALAMPVSGRADDFQLPGLDRDSDAWSAMLLKRVPAGGSPQARRAAEQQAAAALQKKDYTALIAALEQRVALGEAGVAHFQSLAEAYLRRTPPDPAKALLAAWQAFSRADAGTAEVPSLLVMADALRALERTALPVRFQKER